ncbi:hypothetical protein H9P43_002168 [Blastocladiella emersonii ATCC 22665]|nr:hypothetical protein H9P43_002168 [Blastocladiella emersonii ATCC 22665]
MPANYVPAVIHTRRPASLAISAEVAAAARAAMNAAFAAAAVTEAQNAAKFGGQSLHPVTPAAAIQRNAWATAPITALVRTSPPNTPEPVAIVRAAEAVAPHLRTGLRCSQLIVVSGMGGSARQSFSPTITRELEPSAVAAAITERLGCETCIEPKTGRIAIDGTQVTVDLIRGVVSWRPDRIADTPLADLALHAVREMVVARAGLARSTAVKREVITID